MSSKPRKGNRPTLRATKTAFSLNTLLKKLSIHEITSESFRQPSPPLSTEPSVVVTVPENVEEDDLINFEPIQLPLERNKAERVLPDLDSVSLALEATYATSSTSVRVHNDQLDATTLLWTLFSLHSPVTKVNEVSERSDVINALVEKVFPGLLPSVTANIHLQSLALTTPQAYLYLLGEQRKMHSTNDPQNLSDYAPGSRWQNMSSFESWKKQDLQRIGNIDRLLNGDSTQESFPSPILIIQLFQARHLSHDKSSLPKSINMTLSFETKSGRSEKRKMVGITTGEFGTSTTLDATPFILPFSQESHKKLRNSTTEAQFIEHWKSQQATLLIKIRNGAHSKASGTTLAKTRIPLVEIFEQYRGNAQAATEPRWITLGTLSAPEVLLKSIFVLPSDHLKLDPHPLTLGSVYSRLSNRLHTAPKNIASQHSHAILESFSSFFGIGNIRIQLASLESHLLYGDTRVAYDRMMRHVQFLDDIEQRKGKSSENLPMTLSEASLYQQLRPSVQKYAASLVCNCIEAFPDNYPSGALKRAIQMVRHFSTQKSSFNDELKQHLRVSAKRSFYAALYPQLILDDSLIEKQIHDNGLRDKKMLYPVESFATIASSITFAKDVVMQHIQHYGAEFQAEAKFDSTEIYVEVFVEMISRTLEYYFLEGHPELRRERRGSVGRQAQAEEEDVLEHRLVFTSVDTIRAIIKYWQPYTKLDLESKIPIYDYLEHGTRWWLESLDTQMQRWAAEVLVADDFEPLDVSLNLLHSQSVIHLFSISHEALGVITPVLAKWTKLTVIDHLEYFIRCFCKSAEMYCLNVEVMFTQQTSSERGKSRVPTTAEEKRISVERSTGKKQKFVASVGVKSLFAPILRSTKFNQITGRMQGILRISEDPSQLLPAEQRFQVTKRICVQMNNVDTVRTLINERAEMLYSLYETIYDGPLKPRRENDKDDRPKREDQEEWISDRFQRSLRSIRAINDGLINELCAGLLPFIESMLFFIMRMYRSEEDGKVRNEGNRIMSKLSLSKGSVSNEEVSQEMEPVFEFLDDTVEILSKNLHYEVFKRLVKCLWKGISGILDDALLPHAEKHIMKPDQVAKLLCIDLQLKEYFIYDGESLPEAVADSTLHAHQLLAASLNKPARDVIDMLNESKSEVVTELLQRLLQLKAEKDSAAKEWVRHHDLGIKSR